MREVYDSRTGRRKHKSEFTMEMMEDDAREEKETEEKESGPS